MPHGVLNTGPHVVTSGTNRLLSVLPGRGAQSLLSSAKVALLNSHGRALGIVLFQLHAQPFF